MAELTHEDLEELLMMECKDFELKTCPFCGGKVYPVYSSRTQRYYFYHYHGREACVIEEFTMMGDRFASIAEAERAWNRRAE